MEIIMNKKLAKRNIDSLIAAIGKNQKQIGFIECGFELFCGKDEAPGMEHSKQVQLTEKAKCQNNIENIKKDIHIIINNMEV